MLVACLREARQRRQVIIVTHNPNLAVVCDADQIVHSYIDKQHKNKVTYTSGSLENPKTNTLSITVLEGTRLYRELALMMCYATESKRNRDGTHPRRRIERLFVSIWYGQ